MNQKTKQLIVLVAGVMLALAGGFSGLVLLTTKTEKAGKEPYILLPVIQSNQTSAETTLTNLGFSFVSTNLFTRTIRQYKVFIRIFYNDEKPTMFEVFYSIPNADIYFYHDNANRFSLTTLVPHNEDKSTNKDFKLELNDKNLNKLITKIEGEAIIEEDENNSKEEESQPQPQPSQPPQPPQPPQPQRDLLSSITWEYNNHLEFYRSRNESLATTVALKSNGWNIKNFETVSGPHYAKLVLLNSTVFRIIIELDGDQGEAFYLTRFGKAYYFLDGNQKWTINDENLAKLSQLFKGV